MVTSLDYDTLVMWLATSSQRPCFRIHVFVNKTRRSVNCMPSMVPENVKRPVATAASPYTRVRRLSSARAVNVLPSTSASSGVSGFIILSEADTATSKNWVVTAAQLVSRPVSRLRRERGDTRVELARTDLISRAQSGDGEAFRELTEPYRRELQLHCYRMLGSFQDAEDAVQDTLLSAWQGLSGFEGRASLRTWLYRIATNRCLNARRAASRRPAKEWDLPDYEPPEPTRLGEVVWLEPFPDELLERSEAISLAFVTALQLLPPRQVAVLILRDVLGFHASEVAEMLDSTVDSVNSALKRARASLQRRLPPAAEREPAPAPNSPAEQAIVAQFVSAWESADVDALVALLTDDVFVSMPPLAFEYEGRDAAARLCASIFRSGRRFDLVATRANGQPAFGAYLRGATGIRHGVGLYVLTLTGDRICAMTRFENSVLPWFGLPRSLPGR